MANTDKPFHIKLSDEHRAKLEAYRATMGLRSEADAVRALIDFAWAARLAPADTTSTPVTDSDLDAVASEFGFAPRRDGQSDSQFRQQVRSEHILGARPPPGKRFSLDVQLGPTLAKPGERSKKANPQPKTGKPK